MRLIVESKPYLHQGSMGQRLSSLCRIMAEHFTEAPSVIEAHPDTAVHLDWESRAWLEKSALYVMTPNGRAPLTFTWPHRDQIAVVHLNGVKSWRVVLDLGAASSSST